MTKEIDLKNNGKDDNKIVIVYEKNLRIELPTKDAHLIGHLNEFARLIGQIRSETSGMNRLEQIVSNKKRIPLYLRQDNEKETKQITDNLSLKQRYKNSSLLNKIVLVGLTATILASGLAYRYIPQTSFYKEWKKQNVEEARIQNIENLFSNPALVNYAITNSLTKERIETLQKLAGIFPREAIQAYEFLDKKNVDAFKVLGKESLSLKKYMEHYKFINKEYKTPLDMGFVNPVIWYGNSRGYSKERLKQLVEALQPTDIKNRSSNFFKEKPELLNMLFLGLKLESNSSIKDCLQGINELYNKKWDYGKKLEEDEFKRGTLFELIEEYENKNPKGFGDYIIQQERNYRQNQ